MKIAIVHDQLMIFGGAERVLLALHEAFPEAPIYTAFVHPRAFGDHITQLKTARIYQSWMRYIPFIHRLYSPLRFLLPFVWQSFDLSGYDLVICSSSWGICKGVSLQKKRTPATHTKYVCYLHTPPRYLYGYDESSLRQYWPVRLYAYIINPLMRYYDFHSSQTVDQFIFNSKEIRQRSLKFYRRDGIVIEPPIAVKKISPVPLYTHTETPYYITVSRLVPTKHIDVLIAWANKYQKRLVVVGDGPLLATYRTLAGPTVELKGFVTDDTLAEIYTHAQAFLYASKNEDFGIVPVEAMAYKIPVVAYRSGGVIETCANGRGILYHDLTPISIEKAIAKLHALDKKIQNDMLHQAQIYAQNLAPQHFISRMQKSILST